MTIELCVSPTGEDGGTTNVNTNRRRSDWLNPPSHKSHRPSREHRRSPLWIRGTASEIISPFFSAARPSIAIMGISRGRLTKYELQSFSWDARDSRVLR